MERLPMKRFEETRLFAIPIGLAVGYGIILMFLAVLLPIQTVQEQSVSVTPSLTSSSAGQPLPSTPLAVHTVPRESLVKANGQKILLLVAVPTVVAIVVGLLLELRQRRKLKFAGTSAWVLAVTLLAAGLIGFVTFLIGIFVVPIGALLIVACNRVAPLHTRITL
jgi:hypothetical protein